MKKLRFVVSLITKDNDYQLEQAASAQEAAARLGADVQILYADNDSITQSTQLLKIIQSDSASRPDAIILEPVGGTALAQVARAAVTAGIGWGVVNREADYIAELRGAYRVPIFSIAPDHQEIGKIQAKQFAALLPDGGNLLYIQGPSEHWAAKNRTTGLQGAISGRIHVTTLRAQWMEESAQRSVESWLKLNTSSKAKIHVVGAQNDLIAMGARKAFKRVENPLDRERWLNLPYTGCDGVPQTGQSWVREGLLTATIIVPTSTGQALSMLVQSIQTGSRIPERSYISSTSFPAIEKLAGIPFASAVG